MKSIRGKDDIHLVVFNCSISTIHYQFIHLLLIIILSAGGKEDIFPIAAHRHLTICIILIGKKTESRMILIY